MASERRDGKLAKFTDGPFLFASTAIRTHNSGPNLEVVDALRAAGMLVVPAAENVIRILPPLNIVDSHVEEALEIMETVCREIGA